MKKLTSLPFLFTTVAIVEAFYAATALLTPPDFVLPLTGWVLTPDGQWIVKLLGVALGFQAVIAWMFRKNPLIGIAWALAGYQLLAATIDWIMWLALSGDGIFGALLAQATVVASIIIHYALGVLLVIGIKKTKQQTHIQKIH
jgi:hypothetical protein